MGIAPPGIHREVSGAEPLKTIVDLKDAEAAPQRLKSRPSFLSQTSPFDQSKEETRTKLWKERLKGQSHTCDARIEPKECLPPGH